MEPFKFSSGSTSAIREAKKVYPPKKLKKKRPKKGKAKKEKKLKHLTNDLYTLNNGFSGMLMAISETQATITNNNRMEAELCEDGFIHLIRRRTGHD